MKKENEKKTKHEKRKRKKKQKTHKNEDAKENICIGAQNKSL